MKRVLIVLAVAGVLAAAASPGWAQPQARVSWNSCDVYNPNQDFTGPTIYKMVISLIGADDSYSGHDNFVTVKSGPLTYSPLPDAWRFDDAGCQGNTLISYSTAGFTKACAAFQGANPLGITAYQINANNTATMRLANSFDSFVAVPGTRYTLYVVSFDHTYSVAGPSDPGVTCGLGYIASEIIGLDFEAAHELLLTSGPIVPLSGPESNVKWQGGAVATLPATWGRVKGLYR